MFEDSFLSGDDERGPPTSAYTSENEEDYEDEDLPLPRRRRLVRRISPSPSPEPARRRVSHRYDQELQDDDADLPATAIQSDANGIVDRLEADPIEAADAQVDNTEYDTAAIGQKRARGSSDQPGPPTPKALKLTRDDQPRRKDNRGRQADYSEEVQRIIQIAMELYEVRMLTINPFPSSTMEGDWVAEVWAEACKREETKYRITGEIHRMVRHLSLATVVMKY